MRIDDPWHDTLASGWGEEHGATAAPFPRRAAPGTAAATAASSCPPAPPSSPATWRTWSRSPPWPP
ncbi:hypothetical protein [Streptomyces radiopugnans]|uniref:hypothetical protein n=1 Tax=Streptomyces radiopugnans TaxID=403935 RepID=UPI003F1B25F3